MPVGESEADYWFNRDLEIPGIVYDMIPIQTPDLRRHNPLIP
jgi:hypothetical protein